jgi:hypothetical protein
MGRFFLLLLSAVAVTFVVQSAIWGVWHDVPDWWVLVTFAFGAAWVSLGTILFPKPDTH